MRLVYWILFSCGALVCNNKTNKNCVCKNLVGPDSQGKSQNWGFIDEVHGLGWDDDVQIHSLTVCLSGASCCFLCSKLWTLFRGAMLNLTDCCLRSHVGLALLIYLVFCFSAISGVLVHCIGLLVKFFLFGYLSHETASWSMHLLCLVLLWGRFLRCVAFRA